MRPFTHDETIRVRYGETDQMGVVWHGAYIAYFEVARTGALRALGHSYRDIEETGVMMPVVEAGIIYHHPARYDDVLTVRVEIRDRPTARMRFNYTILGQDGAQLATGFTVLAFMDRDTRRPCKPPAFLRTLF
ncbi:MAG: acyl-CoA thioesterase [Lentisphaerae bacterium]|nr:acyl-CoA thioesterase [Lentisphaerota bacterium]